MSIRRLVLTLACVTTAAGARADDVIVDGTAKEIHFPFTFVQASQAIEVFGCSPGGPDHEAILTFRAPGGKIAASLEKIGVRNENFWQVSDRGDFQLTQGDRILMILWWERNGQKVHPCNSFPVLEIEARTSES